MRIKFKEVPPKPVSWPPWVRETLLQVREVPVVRESRDEESKEEGYLVLFGDLVTAVDKVNRATAEWLRTWKSNQPGSTVFFPRTVCEIVPAPSGHAHNGFGVQGGGGRSG